MTKKILFLDDDDYRIKLFKTRHFASIVKTSHSAKFALSCCDPFDIASLDHDLGGEYLPSDENSGYGVAKYISTMKDPPKKIIIHSFNQVGASNMYYAMKGLNVYIAKFNSEYYWSLLE